MKLGIIGMPGVGKTTVFGALTQNFPEEGHKRENRIGMVQVPDQRVDTLSKMYKPKKTIYAQVEYLLPDMSGQKRDQNIWNHVRDCDALIHVVRNFSGYGFDDAVPDKDFFNLAEEMVLADLVVAEKRIERIELDKKRGKDIDVKEMSLLRQCLKSLEDEIPLRKNSDLANARQLRGFAFVSARPMLLLFNNEDDDDNVPKIKDLVEQEDCMVIRGKLELELSQMSEDDAKEFLEEFNITASAMDRVVRRSYKLLGLISFFTVGEDEVRAWTIKADTPAVDAAEVIHSDIKKGFIRAEVLSYDDLMDAGTYQEARKKGTVRLEGKTYRVQDGDIINFRFNV
jgi:GTP-binding protein YchF